MSVYISNYPEATDNGTAYGRQTTAIQDAIQTYGTDQKMSSFSVLTENTVLAIVVSSGC